MIHLGAEVECNSKQTSVYLDSNFPGSILGLYHLDELHEEVAQTGKYFLRSNNDPRRDLVLQLMSISQRWNILCTVGKCVNYEHT